MKYDKRIKQLEDRLEFAGWIGGGGGCDDSGIEGGGCGGNGGDGPINIDED